MQKADHLRREDLRTGEEVGAEAIVGVTKAKELGVAPKCHTLSLSPLLHTHDGGTKGG